MIAEEVLKGYIGIPYSCEKETGEVICPHCYREDKGAEGYVELTRCNNCHQIYQIVRKVDNGR